MGGGGRPAVIRAEPHGAVRARRRVRRPVGKGRQARRFAHRATDKVRAGGKSEDGEGNRHRAVDGDPAARRRGDRMKRRAFITLLGGAAVWPLAASAQQAASTVRRIGLLLPGNARTTAVRGQLEAFRQGLKEYGWVEGQNIIVEYSFAEVKRTRFRRSLPSWLDCGWMS